ncbi:MULTISPECIES: SRPBCC domain-containing protein [unclassified Niallia]|uniref:SRPBCC family protein n=1 Tax=Niallia TaxID=2837506 RepID=UPI001EDB8BBE|nr:MULTISPECIES: SRPBCC domain-containing protein [unclassified Niallia]MCM3030737.1 SRPBCC domain-containing protein [Niallia sp. MER 6]MDL0435845.1 SRPBCC domain-containing protein [Niallia sp. SS-2023]UPO86189.1 SRPBCC domain-containing protein [Niallia sp. Man26]
MTISQNQDKVQDIVQTITIDADIQKVWNFVSTSDGIAAWFMPNNFEAKLGHEFHLQSPFGPSPCKVTELNPPHKLAFDWDTEGWFVTFSLQEVNGKTEFTIVHGGWKANDELIGKANEKSAIIRDRMNQGWGGIVQKLKKEAEA